MFGEFTGEQQFDGGLDLSGAEGSLFVISHQFAGFQGESVEGVTNEGVHDVHGSLADTDIRVDLSQHLVDVEGEGLDSLSVDLSLTASLGLGGLGGGLGLGGLGFAGSGGLLGGHLSVGGVGF